METILLMIAGGVGIFAVALHFLWGFLLSSKIANLRRRIYEVRIEWADKHADARLLPRLREKDFFPRKERILFILLWPVRSPREEEHLEKEIHALRSAIRS